jgi:endonuclease-3
MPRLLSQKKRHDLADQIFDILSSDNPNPQTELEYVNDFTLLVAVVLSAQATDKGVNKATKALFQIADTPQKMLDLGLDHVTDHIKTIGLYKNKGKNVIALSKMIIEDFDGNIPQNRDDLVKLPGVGRKTANVIMNVAFHQPTIAVDTHIFRLSNRLGLSNGKTPDDVEDDLVKIIPKRWIMHAHHWLILHGRYVCKARTPDCTKCKIQHLCNSADKTI